jgi:ATP-dependent exoDNAse (exonuclease V) beta subunit
MIDARLTVYNAGAGSGKTFQIAVNFLNKIIQAQDQTYIYRLLGITFTNKAAGEMKNRIINSLIAAAQGKILGVMKVVAEQSKDIICKQTGITNDEDYHKEIIHRSKKRLFEILHRYDDFQLMTIDKLMYKIIRTFARDMQLGNDVEVIIEYKDVINNIIDKLINQAQPGSLLSRFLIDMALEKTDEEKYWDIKTDLVNISPIIFDENNYENIKSLSNKNLRDFLQLHRIVQQEINKIKVEFIRMGKELKLIIGDFDIYISKTINTLAYRLQYEHSKIEINKTIRKQFEADDYYYYIKKSVKDIDPGIKAIITQNLNEQIHQSVQKIVKYADRYLEQFKLLQALSKEIKSLSIQNELQKEIDEFKYENNSIFINDFNKLILEHILKDLETDTPYIYMRLGEKYAHYFVDEFQDTSILQWKNLIPLIKEGLSKEFNNKEKGSVMIVGDAKQSIYRFRGGKPEQFIALSETKNHSKNGNPFARITGKKVIDLAYNWRSDANIIHFNNQFFSTFSSYLPVKYQTVYQKEKVSQKIPENKEGDKGYVQIRFLQKNNKQKEIETENFPEIVLQTVHKAVLNGFSLDEICILVDKKIKGSAIAEILNQNNIDVISSESLLVVNSHKVQFLLSWFRFLDSGKAADLFPAVRYLTERKGINDSSIYQKIFEHTNLSKKQQIEKFSILGYDLNYHSLTQYHLYDLSVYLIDKFHLNDDDTEQVYLQNFMEKIYQFYSTQQGSIYDFLQEWQQIENNFSISTANRKNAVQIMTVHRSKGLEFPVVIYYTEGSILNSDDKKGKVWIPVNPDIFNGFSKLPVRLGSLENTTVSEYRAIYEEVAGEKIFDNINRLYVALTRAVEQLFVIVPSLSSKSSTIGYNQLLMNHLIHSGFEKNQQIYEFGNPERKKNLKKEIHISEKYDRLYYQTWQAKNTQDSFLKINYQNYEQWKDDKKEAIKYGMLIHQILSKITTVTDWNKLKDKYLSVTGETERKQIELLIDKLLHHPRLEKYFQNDVSILNEQSILLPQGLHFSQKRPDRLVIKDGILTIIDYKTGEPHTSHQKQIDEYEELLEKMGFTVKEKILVYLKENAIQVVVNGG